MVSLFPPLAIASSVYETLLQKFKMVPIIFVLLVLLITILYYLEVRNRHYFESKGIPYTGNGTIRYFINSANWISFTEGLTVIHKKMRAKGAKVAGMMEFGQVTLIVMDPDIVKSIMVSDFDHFVDRRVFPLPKMDYLFQRMLIALKGDSWKALRLQMSPVFTSGKINRLFPLLDHSGKRMVQFLENEAKNSPDGEMDITNGFRKLTMDIVASAICGLDSGAFDQSDPSLFEKMGMILQHNFEQASMLKVFLTVFAPKLCDILGLSFFEMDMQRFFSTAIRSVIQQRTKEGVKREDFVQMMLEAREGRLKTDSQDLDRLEKDYGGLRKGNSGAINVSAAQLLDDEGIIANCVQSSLGGSETIQSLLLFSAYALALHPDMQNRLRAEVDMVLEEGGGEFTYDSLHKMHYMDMVINETLRLYPPAGITERVATQDYKVPGTDFILREGDAVQISITGLHHDAEFFPEPTKFDPERFSASNKVKVKPYSFIPFGKGPRICIGMRMSLTEVKVTVAHLVHNFIIKPSKRTLIPMKFEFANAPRAEGGMFLGLEKIQRT